MLEISKHPTVIKLKDTYAGPWRTSIIRNKQKLASFIELVPVYLQAVPISSAKLKNIKDLLPYLKNAENRKFYEKIFSQQDLNRNDELEIDEDDNSSGCEN